MTYPTKCDECGRYGGHHTIGCFTGIAEARDAAAQHARQITGLDKPQERDEQMPQGGHAVLPGGGQMPKNMTEIMRKSILTTALGTIPETTLIEHFIETFLKRYEGSSDNRSVSIQFGEWTAAVPLGDIRQMHKRLRLLP